jgi:WD40 repeat protein
VICTPGTRPFTAVAQALLPEFAGDADAPSSLLLFEEADVAVGLVARWRQQHKHALVIIDQFEELFTQNPLEVQARFTELLGRLALEADVQVLLSMRDDFLFHCAPQESLAPIFSELTPLKSLSGAALRRALVQPALKCGYKFENESLIDEMVAEVEGERGALPMLAFAAARLWDHRDREQGLLTDEAYERIGGVGGALAQHAEATLEKIGRDQAPIVRELFRNLVTAQGTRAARTRDELLSVFDRGHDPRVEGHDPESRGDSGRVPARDRVPESPERPAPISGEREDAARVLNTLIDARLLTSYEEPASEDEEQPHHRIEIIHESLLTNWPRLVRWRTQDQEGAQLRDELRQAAQKWDQRDRSEDLLWTGTSFREFELWRDRYPGGLTGLEEEYGHAMTSKALRRKRRRRLAVAAMLVIAATVTAVTGTLWRQSERSEQLARDEALRAEASKLLALAQLRHGEDPTEALAYTTASLELADTKEARIFAMRVLWEGPPALELRPEESEDLSIRYPRFSPDGNRLAVAGHDEWVRVWTAEGAEPPVVLPGHLLSNRGSNAARWVSNELLATGLCCGNAPRSDVWRFPGGEKVRTIDFGGPSYWQVGGNHLRAEVVETDAASGHEVYRLRSWGLPDGDPRELGRVDWSALGASESTLLPNGKDWLYAKGESVYLRPLPAGSGKDDRLLGRHPTEVEGIYPLQVDPAQVYSRDRAGEIRIWDFSKEEPKLAKVISQPEGEPEWRFPDPSLRWADAWLGPEGNRQARVWDLDAWPQARPLTLRRSGSWIGALHAFHPRGDWLVVSTQALAGLTFWPLLGEWPRIVDGYSGLNRHLVFSPDGHWLATLWADGTLRLWPLPGSGSLGIRTLTLPGEAWNMRLVFDPHGRFLFLVGGGGRANVVPLDGSTSRKLGASDDDVFFIGAAVSPSGRLVATAYGGGPGEPTLRVWDLETGELRLFDLPEGSIDDDWAVVDVAFADETTLYTAGVGGVHRWILPSGAHELVLGTKPGYMMAMMFGPDERTALVHESVIGGGRAGGSISIVDLVTGVAQALPEYGDQNRHTFALDTSGRLAIAGDREGIVRVGRVAGGEPHLLVGHEGPVDFVAISPDGRWIGSTGEDNTLRLWPMPDLDKPPFHTLPRHEFIAKLKSLTNIRVVRDPESAEGWRVELDPFPGWKTVPRW